MSIEDEFGMRRQVVDLRTFNTQLGMLQSKKLALRVAERLNLPSRPEFEDEFMPRKSLVSSLKGILTFRWLRGRKKGQEQVPGVQPDLYAVVAEALRSGLKVSPVRDTKLVEISYSSRLPNLSAEVVNAYAEEFKEFVSDIKYERTEKFSSDLNKQIDNLRVELEARQRELQRYAREKGLILTNPESEEESAVIAKYRDLYNAYNQAVIERNRRAAVYFLVRDLDVDSLPQSLSDPRIQPLQSEYLAAKNDYAEKSRRLGSNNPELIQAKERLDRARENLEAAIKATEYDYNIALQNERSLQRELERQEAEISRMNSDIVFYNTLSFEVQNLQTRYNSLLNIQTQINASKELESLKASNISVVDPAEVPRKPESPDKTKNLILAILFGLFGGVGLCFLLEYLDNTVKGPEEVEKLAGLPSLGVIPLLEPEEASGTRGEEPEYAFEGIRKNPEKRALPKAKDIELINHFFPRLPIADEYRTVRTSILLSHAESPPKVLAVTSSLPVEGKSSTLVNLAVAFAQLEKKVLLVDSDIRKPRLHRIFKVGNIGGLSGYLAGKVDLEKAIVKTMVNHVWLMPSGPIPPNPSELLDSARMKQMLKEVRKAFDVVLLDTPPVLASIDAVILSTLVESTVLVIKAGELTRKPFMSAVSELRRAKAKIIGVVFNGLKASQGKYFYRGYYPYYRYGYYGGREESRSEAEH
ncbi:MAG: GumC family protein [Candidatus Aminicenantales bacterium]